MVQCASADKRVAGILDLFTEKCPGVQAPQSSGGEAGDYESFSVFPNGIKLKQVRAKLYSKGRDNTHNGARFFGSASARRTGTPCLGASSRCDRPGHGAQGVVE